MTMTMFQRKISDSLTNGNGKFTSILHEKEPATIWRRLHVNELTFSVSLFLFSLSIILGKLCVEYGELSPWQIGERYSLPVTTFARMYDKIGVPSISTSLRNNEILNTTDQYAETTADVLLTFYGRYGWFMRAIMSGIILTGFTWFIIYMDSSVPGVNPPFPFSLSRQRQRIPKGLRIQVNYLVGMLNGLLFFIYMCL